MAAAYATLMSLMNTSEMILHPYQQWFSIHRNMIGSLLQKVCFLQEFLEDYSHRGHEEMAGLERKITDMAYGAEDFIEFHAWDHIQARSTCSDAKSCTRFSENIHKVIEEMEDLIENKLTRIKETIGKFEEEDRTLIDFSPAVSSRLAPNEQNTLVGSDEKLNEIMDILTGQQSNCQTIAIVGMGGIGKTTLAKNIYEHPYIKLHFDIRAWATISQNYSARKIISEILSEIGLGRAESLLSDDQLRQQSCKSEENDYEQLGGQLHKDLCGKRYLILMDDLWSIEAWDEIRRFFPDQDNGSRILITTRLRKVAAHLSSCRPFQMKFLDSDRSWELLREKVFGHRGCPPELEELGKAIAENCGGLPLAIVVIGGLLAKSDKTMVLWRHVAENLNSITNSEDNERCLKILSLSYNNLPIHLKPCFLYLGMAPELSNIPWLIKVWVSEGFLKPIRGKSLEEAANKYLRDLVHRNLILVRRWTRGRLESCGIHDLLRDLCLREAQKIKLCGMIDVQNPHIFSEVKFTRGIDFGLYPLKRERSMPSNVGLLGPLSRSIIRGLDSTPWYATTLRLLRLLDKTPTILPNENFQLVNLRFMCFLGKNNFDRNSILRFTSWISLFWNLQTLQLWDCSFEPVVLPPEIWSLPHLRHLNFTKCVLPDPPCCDIDKHDSLILKNMQTLSCILFFKCSEEVCRRLPNLRGLDLTYDPISPGVEWPFFRLHNLVNLRKLKSLIFEAHSPISSKYLSFPLSLKNLTLSSCGLPWEDMAIVGSLPNLKALMLQCQAFKGLRWCPVEGHFVKLKILVIWEADLLDWRADKTHFPVLLHLMLGKLNLKEFPENFGEHPTLRTIQGRYCSDSTNAWAEQVRAEQESFGNENFEVSITERLDLIHSFKFNDVETMQKSDKKKGKEKSES